MSGPYKIASDIHPRLVVKQVSQTEVVTICMVAPGLTSDEAREQAQTIVNALNAYHPTPKPTAA